MNSPNPHQRLAEFLADHGLAARDEHGDVAASNPTERPFERWGTLQLSVEAADLLFQVCSLAQLDRTAEEQIYVQAMELGGDEIIEVRQLRRLLGVTLFERSAFQPGGPGLTPPEWKLLLG